MAILEGEAKRDLLKDVAGQCKYDTFIETGTADGNTVIHLADTFDRLYTIEIAEDFYWNAWRFCLPHDNIKLIHGDSAVVLQWLLAAIPDKPAMYWLDAHYNGRGDGTNPLIRELDHIFYRNQKNWILIDDAREFGSDPEYPTLEEVEERMFHYMRWGSPPYKMNVADDIIYLIPNG